MVPETTHSPPGGAPDDHVDTEPGVTLDPTEVDAETNALAASARIRSGASRARLDSIERTILHSRIAILEQALEAKDRQRTALIDQYENILAERERAADDDAVSIEFEDAQSTQGLLGSLRGLLRRR